MRFTGRGMPEVVEGLVSTIIPVHNRSAMLRDAVESVMAQTYRMIEIIIADDGSTDGSGVLADRMAAEHPGIIRVTHSGVNQGAGAAREAGRRMARGEFIQYLDSDDLLLPGKFECQVGALRHHAECGVSYGSIRLMEADGSIRSGPYKGSGECLDYLFPRLLVERWWNSDSPLYRRSVCDVVGSWSRLRYSQDWEYDARVGALKTRLARVPDYVCIQRQHRGPRQTGHGGWLSPRDRVTFFSCLLACARKADVPVGSPEMEHFSKWVFLNARQSGAMGDSEAAQSLYSIACETAQHPSARRSMVGWLARWAGWKVTGALCEMAAGLRDRRGRR